MTIRLIEGFENFGPSGTTGLTLQTAISKRYVCDTTYSTDAILVDGWGSGVGLKWPATSGTEYLQMVLMPGDRSITIGFALKTPIFSGMQYSRILFDTYYAQAQFQHFDFGLSVNGYLLITNYAGTDIWISNTALRSDQWVYIEIKAWLDTTASGTIEIRINGVVDSTYTGISAYLTNIASIVNWYGASADCILDDIYIATSSDGLDGYYGPARVETLHPSDDAGLNDWTPSSAVDHYTLVNTIPVNTSNYLVGETGSELFEYPNTSLDTIKAVKISSEVLTDATSISQINQICVNGANTYDGDIFNIISTDPFEVQDIFELNPETANSWEPSELNASQFGIERL